MKIILKNKELAPAINFLQSITLKAADSRHRSKLVKLLINAYEELNAEEKVLLGKFDLLDKNGELLDGQKQDQEKAKACSKEQSILMDEEVEIEGGTYAKNIDKVQGILESYEGEMSGTDAEMYDRLLDEFEKNNKKKKAAE